jgi:hypothetical protein
MKKLFTLLLLLGFSLGAWAQVLINEGFEGTGVPAGWTNITAATDGGWKVGTHTALSSQFWGIDNPGTGKIAATNDDGCNCNKNNDIFVTPPIDASALSAVRMEFDLFFNGGTYQGATEKAWVAYSTDGGTTWTDVLQLTGAAEWQTVTVDINQLAGVSDGHIGFRYSDAGGWLFGCAIDNVKIFKPFDKDVSITLNPISRYNLLNTSLPITGTITNNGLETVTSVDISWTDGVNNYTDNLAGLNIPAGGSYNFTHSASLLIENAIAYNLEVTAANPNGQADENEDNNTASALSSGISFKPARKMVAEEATGTWCGWCPRGFVFMDMMEKTYDDFIGIGVHNGDPMVNTAYDDGLTSFPGFSGFPSVVVDRRQVIDPNALETYYNANADRIVPASAEIVDALIDPVTRVLTINAQATFATQMADSDYRFNVVLVEDDVKGTGSGYNQVNFYSFQANNIPLVGYHDFNWQTLPNPVPASQMIYDIVAREIMGGWAGWVGTEDVEANDVVSGNWTYTVPTTWNFEKMRAIFMIIDGVSGEIINADKRSIWTVSTTETQNVQRFRLSPNPTSGFAALELQLNQAADVQIELINTVGQVLSVQRANNSFGDMYYLDLSNQPAGMYFVKATIGNEVRVERLMVAK